MTAHRAAQASPSIFPGATISGRFRIERLLGRGSMGAVWLARHLTLDMDVAVKFIDAAFRDEKDHRSRFVMEAQSAARISSPHVVNVLDFGEDGGRLYIAMEYLVGEDLGSFLERGNRLSLEVTARIVAHACRGLGKAHALGIAHRDIKPENLFLCGDAEDEGFVLKILDFGVAKSSQKSSFSGTTAGQLIGSPAYMSPEQARGLPNIDGRSDLFSLAVVAYHCLTGTPPFSGDSLAELLLGIVGLDPDPVTQHLPGLPPALDAWFARALEKNPNKRFPTAKEMAQAFYMAIGQHASSATDYVASRSLTASVGARTVVAGEGTVIAGELPAQATSSSARVSLTSVSVSNQTSSAAVASSLCQLGEVPHVLGAGLVSPGLTTVAHYSAMGLAASTFTEVAERARGALDAFENLESSRHQAVGLHFESATILLRWIDAHLLVVVGTEQVHPTVLTVSLNTAASKLLSLANQAGGAEVAFRATLSGVKQEPEQAASASAPPSASDLVSDSVVSQLTQLFAKPLGALGRLAVQQRMKSGKPSYGRYPEFVSTLASAIEDATARELFLKEALALVPRSVQVPTPAAAPVPPGAGPLSARGAGAPAPSPKGPTPPGASAAPPTAAAAPAAPAKTKRVIVYRGSRIERDD